MASGKSDKSRGDDPDQNGQESNQAETTYDIMGQNEKFFRKAVPEFLHLVLFIFKLWKVFSSGGVYIESRIWTIPFSKVNIIPDQP